MLFRLAVRKLGSEIIAVTNLLPSYWEMLIVDQESVVLHSVSPKNTIPYLNKPEMVGGKGYCNKQAVK